MHLTWRPTAATAAAVLCLATAWGPSCAAHVSAAGGGVDAVEKDPGSLGRGGHAGPHQQQQQQHPLGGAHNTHDTTAPLDENGVEVSIEKPKRKKRKNIIVILTDDQDLTMDSAEYMPLLKEHIADKGITFRNHLYVFTFKRRPPFVVHHALPFLPTTQRCQDQIQFLTPRL